MTIRGREHIADWIEVSLLVRGPRPIGLDALLGFFQKSQGLEPQRLTAGLREMSRRASLLGSRYPFKIHGEYAVRSENHATGSTYALLTLLSPGNPVREYLGAVPDDGSAVHFESVVVDAVKSIWGVNGRALRFGWPSDVGRPPEFDLAIQWLAQQIGVPVGLGYRQPRRKDGGVDVVGWRPFPDRRSGFPVLLVQCTLQENLVAKGLDIDRRLWSSWLAMDVDPETALATPAALTVGPVWDELALKYMVLDRLRLVGLAVEQTTDEVALGWVRQTVDELHEHLGEVEEL
ncbi:hypothetical protein [Microlunatus antarcticus]|uniref:Uncharacterized protein n=1 Tax=Microlunatus antarcticus TaxID=53388 RepID=A0A7W5P8S3_9ACTN|nr:hypothetical protein [Microlunatus antarcticus]MBB3328807.1 hypothetical protein [Microlunatus antarcticus]